MHLNEFDASRLRKIATPPRARTLAWHHGRLEDVSSDSSSLAHSLSFESSPSLLRIFSESSPFRNLVELLHFSTCETGLLTCGTCEQLATFATTRWGLSMQVLPDPLTALTRADVWRFSMPSNCTNPLWCLWEFPFCLHTPIWQQHTAPASAQLGTTWNKLEQVGTSWNAWNQLMLRRFLKVQTDRCIEKTGARKRESVDVEATKSLSH